MNGVTHVIMNSLICNWELNSQKGIKQSDILIIPMNKHVYGTVVSGLFKPITVFLLWCLVTLLILNLGGN